MLSMLTKLNIVFVKIIETMCVNKLVRTYSVFVLLSKLVIISNH